MADEDGKMSLEDFKEQEEYCRKNNTPEGCGCVGCPGENTVCADNVRNIMGKIREEECPKIREEEDHPHAMPMNGVN